jgi:hypothetical protein
MLATSCLHALYMMCNVTMTSLIYIQSLGVNIESPPQVNIKLGFPCGCQAATKAHKSHHQTHEAPTSFQSIFSPNKECNVVPMMIYTFPTPRARENTFAKLQNSTLPLSEENIFTTLHKWEFLSMLQKHQHSLLVREEFHPPSSFGSSSVSHTRSSTTTSL